MATMSRTSDLLGTIERLRKAPDLRWANQHYTASGIRATIIDALSGTEYDLELRPKDDQQPIDPTPFDRAMYGIDPVTCGGCSHPTHDAHGCGWLAAFTRKPCRCDFHRGER